MKKIACLSIDKGNILFWLDLHLFVKQDRSYKAFPVGLTITGSNRLKYLPNPNRASCSLSVNTIKSNHVRTIVLRLYKTIFDSPIPITYGCSSSSYLRNEYAAPVRYQSLIICIIGNKHLTSKPNRAVMLCGKQWVFTKEKQKEKRDQYFRNIYKILT